MKKAKRNTSWIYAGILILLSCGFAASCGWNSEFSKAPGFTKVKSLETKKTLYLNKTRTSWEMDGVRFYTLEAEGSGAYTIFSMFSDCDTTVVKEHGIMYSSTGETTGNIENSQSSPLTASPIQDEIQTLCANAIRQKRFVGPFDPNKALQVLYGNFDEPSKTATWNEVRLPNGEQFTPLAEHYQNTQGLVAIRMTQTFTDGDNEKVALLTRIVPLTYEGMKWGWGATSDLMGGAVFVKDKNNDAWTLEAETKVFDTVGCFHEQIEKIQPIELGPHKTGLAVTARIGYAGSQAEYEKLLTVNHFHIRNVFQWVSYESGGDEETCRAEDWTKVFCSKYTAKRETMPNPSGEYYLLQISTTGNRYDTTKNAQMSMNSVKAYEFSEGRYKERK